MRRIGLPSIITLLAILLICIDVANAFDKAGGLGASADDGGLTDSARVVFFIVAGMLLSRYAVSRWAFVLYALGFNLLDKAFLASRTVVLAMDSSLDFSYWSLLWGIVAIFALTSPLAVFAAFSGRFTERVLFRTFDLVALSKELANGIVTFSLCALLVPLTFTLNFYSLLLVHDFPIFYLSLSFTSILILGVMFLSAAAITLAIWTYVAASARRGDGWMMVLAGTISALIALRALLAVA